MPNDMRQTASGREPHLHRNLVPPVIEALQRVFDRNEYADRTVDRILKSDPRRGARDRAFIAETVYDMVRHWRLLWETDGAPDSLDPPDLARLFAVHRALRHNAIPPWPEFQGLDAAALRRRGDAVATRRAVRESVPDWLDQLCERELGERWDREIHSLNQPAAVVLRANTLRTTAARLAARLAADGIETQPVPDLPDALALVRRRNAMATEAFREGWFEVQDASSQRVALFLGAAPGMRVVDACAGAGGKTLHLAALMGNHGRIVALDVDARRLEETRRRARRAGVTNLETRLVASARDTKRLAGTADRLLLDAPCSGLGVLRRQPDTKWKLTPQALDGLRALQARILDRYSPIVKPGGEMVYATCSILPSENEERIAGFLHERADRFALLEERRLWPSETGFDGFYMARLKRLS